MNDLKAAKEQFDRDGFLYIPGFFDTALMDELDALICDHFGMTPEFWHNDEFLEKSQVEVVPWFPQMEGIEAFDQVDRYGEFEALTRALLGDGWQNLYSMTMFSAQGTKGQAWHQDCSPDVSSEHNVNRLVYTADITNEIGGQVVFVPGSHKLGEVPVGEPHGPLEGEMTLAPNKGDLLFLHGHCWHRVLPITGQYRTSTNYRAAPKGTPEDITDICVYRNMRYSFKTNEVIEERVAEQKAS